MKQNNTKRKQLRPRANTVKGKHISRNRLTDDVCVDLHLSVLLRQLEGFVVAVG